MSQFSAPARVFYIRRTPLIVPLLVLFGALRSRSSLALEGAALRVRFGWLFDNTIALEDIEGAERTSWPWLGGLGWRTNFSGTIALVGSYGGIVQIRLKSKRRLHFLLPFFKLATDKLVLSLDEPDEFIATLTAAIRSAT